MPNLAKIYSDAVSISSKGIDSSVDLREQTVAEVTPENRIKQDVNWQNATVTKEFFSSVSDRIIELEKQARNLAVSFPAHHNQEGINQALIRSDELRKLISTYATSY